MCSSRAYVDFFCVRPQHAAAKGDKVARRSRQRRRCQSGRVENRHGEQQSGDNSRRGDRFKGIIVVIRGGVACGEQSCAAFVSVHAPLSRICTPVLSLFLRSLTRSERDREKERERKRERERERRNEICSRNPEIREKIRATRDA